MSHRQPPALALWLLDRLGFARGNAPLVGDLLEEFRSGRSALWFWRQTLTVVADCVGRRVALLQVYWIAVALGFVVQLPLSLLLFRLHLPPPAHGLGWKIAAFLLIFICLALVPPLGRRAFGTTSKDLKLILVKPGAGVIEPRPALIGATAFESFGCMLLLYCICCVISTSSPFSSAAEVVIGEFVWLGIGEVTSELALAAVRSGESRRVEAEARKAAEEREWETRVWPHLNELEVPLICSDGTTLSLNPETCVETIFASANQELIASLFKGGIALEQIRRAIWLASAADHSWPKPVPISKLAPVPVAKFARLLGPGTENERMMRYLDVRPPESFPKRLLRQAISGPSRMFHPAQW
jgi:hypothetical protein